MPFHLTKIMMFCCFLISSAASATVIDGWDIRPGAFDIRPELSLEQEVETYTGDIMLHHIEHKPTPEHVYVLVPITAVRVVQDAPAFNAAAIQLKAGDTVLNRLADDTFLVDYNIVPMTRLKIKLGTRKGTVIFEVPKDATQNLTLLYQQKPVEE